MTPIRRKDRRSPILLAMVLALAVAGTAGATLRPSEVAVLANSSFAGSVELAKYYCSVRGVPQSHIITVAMPDGERIARSLYEKSIAVQFREKLRQIPQSEKIRCVLTVRGVPLRIGSAQPSEAVRLMLSKLDKDRKQAGDELEGLLERAKQVAGLREPLPVGPENESLESRLKRLHKLAPEEMERARQKVEALPESLYKRTAEEKLNKVVGAMFGLAGEIERLKRQEKSNGNGTGTKRLAELEKELGETNKKIAGLMVRRVTQDELEKAGELVRQVRGVWGLIQHLGATRIRLRYPYEKSSSSFDSELSMVLAGAYPSRGPIANLLNLDYRARKRVRILMVSRIDGESDRVARRLIDMAVRTENRGLGGRAYIDAGWERAKKKGYQGTEESLLATAKLLKRHSGMAVSLDTKSEVFAQGSCLQAGLYCGWYSLKKYVDAFEWVEGAVGYHIASFEMESLRNPKFPGWASSMVRDGITATLGAVEEPFLMSFPPPERFFTLLLTGKFSLAECYYMSKKFNSWRLVLIGDPLYRPFARNPRLSIEQAEKILKCKLRWALPTVPWPKVSISPPK
ncbi:MAG: TIGR03790 family protein [Phycisphaerae bacterium]|nr:TIGR03790 family protein [Phycisphaerae bacterium]